MIVHIYSLSSGCEISTLKGIDDKPLVYPQISDICPLNYPISFVKN